MHSFKFFSFVINLTAEFLMITYVLTAYVASSTMVF
jgi:hypothetical protein